MCTHPIKIKVNDEIVTVKCGKCLTCRKEKASDWTIKLIKESKYHKQCCFITLTFSNKILLDKKSKAHKYGCNENFIFDIKNSAKYFQKFMKRLRKHYSDRKITFYHIGEYGEEGHRPHHHAIIFGTNFLEDRQKAELSKSGKEQFFSQTLEDLWACGRTRLQDINPKNIAYISKYNVKKFANNNKKYKPTQTFSNRSKMNCKWIRKYPENLLKGFLTDEDGKKYKIPRSYLENMKKETNNRYEKYYLQYDDKIQDYMLNVDNKELLRKQKAQEEIYTIQNRLNKRQF